MKLTLKKDKLLYDIANLAYVIADTGESDHKLHRLVDICQEGNIDRVAQILGLAFAKLQNVLAPVLVIRHPVHDHDFSVVPRNYVFHLKDGFLSGDLILKLKEVAYEYMVCMVLKDWLEITLRDEAGVWSARAEKCISALAGLAAGSSGIRRSVPPL